MFSFKPGIAHVATTVAIGTVLIIVFMIYFSVATSLLGGGVQSGSDAKTALTHAAEAGMGVIFGGIVVGTLTFFGTAAYVMSPLCRWAAV